MEENKTTLFHLCPTLGAIRQLLERTLKTEYHETTFCGFDCILYSMCPFKIQNNA